MDKITTLSTESIVVVRFRDGKTYFFGSLAAIFERFTPAEVGCPLYRLWRGDALADGRVYDTGRCVIARGVLYRKRQRAKQ